ncbi:carboxypeptidase-like regulatory domain-containing protein, partial [Myxococcota bacterium]|nr:carboxypeptidase-like regulatory domain-containing protein [Myxococcota bacterium]
TADDDTADDDTADDDTADDDTADDDTTPEPSPCDDLPASGPYTAPNTTGWISGTVIDQIDGAPVGGVLVEGNGFWTNTDAFGNYELNVAAPGTVAMTFSHPGYTTGTTVWDAEEFHFTLRPLEDPTLPGEVAVELSGFDASNEIDAVMRAGNDFYDRFRVADDLDPTTGIGTISDLAAGWGWVFGNEVDGAGNLLASAHSELVDTTAGTTVNLPLSPGDRWALSGSVLDPLGTGEDLTLFVDFFDCNLGFISSTGHSIQVPSGAWSGWLPSAPEGTLPFVVAKTAGDEFRHRVSLDDPGAVDFDFPLARPEITSPADLATGVGATPTVTWAAPSPDEQVGTILVGLVSIGPGGSLVWSALIDGRAGITSIEVPASAGVEVGRYHKLSMRWSTATYDSPNWGAPGAVWLPGEEFVETGDLITITP